MNLSKHGTSNHTASMLPGKTHYAKLINDSSHIQSYTQRMRL